MRITLEGDTPSKKNKRNIFVGRNGKIMNLPSQQYSIWHDTQMYKLPRLSNPIETTLWVAITFYSSTRRKFDLSNKTESVMDLLVDGKILLDDNYEVVPKLVLNYGGWDKENPRIEIEIVTEEITPEAPSIAESY